MDELDFDPDAFAFPEPPWLVAEADYQREALAGESYFFGGDDPAGRPFVAIFSDEDLAQRMIDQGDQGEDFVPVQFEDIDQFTAFLRPLIAAGCTVAILDPVREDGVQTTVSLCRLLEEMERAEGEGMHERLRPHEAPARPLPSSRSAEGREGDVPLPRLRRGRHQLDGRALVLAARPAGRPAAARPGVHRG
jgi:hypothetical protein